ncbi:MAG: S-layer homology domain-containing protein [Clostridiales bacterium]|nr:S-layer homology domain-containing protein [Clostridiales bacterium]
MKKKIMTTMLVIAMLASMPCAANAFNSSTYSDVDSTAWYYWNVAYITDKGGFDGYDDGTFKPDKTMTQQEFIKTVVAMLAGEQKPIEDPAYKISNDVNDWENKWDKWAQPYLTKAIEMGLIDKEEDKSAYLYNDNAMSRYEVARVMTRAMEYLGEAPAENCDEYKAHITDYYDTYNRKQLVWGSDEVTYPYRVYCDYILQVYAKGLMEGYDDYTFGGENTVTRAEAASVILRLVDKTKRLAVAKIFWYYDEAISEWRQVGYNEPLRTDVDPKYWVTLKDMGVSVKNYREKHWSDGMHNLEAAQSMDSIVYRCGVYNWALVQNLLTPIFDSVKYDKATDTVTFTIPDIYPYNLRPSVAVGLVNDKGRGSLVFDKPGEYSVCYADVEQNPEWPFLNQYEFVRGVNITLKPKNENGEKAMGNMGYNFEHLYRRMSTLDSYAWNGFADDGHGMWRPAPDEGWMTSDEKAVWKQSIPEPKVDYEHFDEYGSPIESSEYLDKPIQVIDVPNCW